MSRLLASAYFHQRLGHASFKLIQQLFALPRDGSRQILTPRHQGVSTCELPRCEACQYAKQKRRPTSSSVKKTSLETEGGLSDNVLEPGQTVSADLYQSTIRGRLPHTKGKEPDDENAKSSSTLWFERIVGKSSSGRSIGRLSLARGPLLCQGIRTDRGP
jgi:hypothetical protein